MNDIQNERHTFLIAYDIRDPKRLIKVHKAVSRRAFALQYSLFVADLDANGINELKQAISACASKQEDDVRVYLLRQDSIGAWQGQLPTDEYVNLFGSPAANLARRLRDTPWGRSKREKEFVSLDAKRNKWKTKKE